MVEQDHVGLDVEETEGDLPVAERFKFERHHSILAYRPRLYRRRAFQTSEEIRPTDERSGLRNYIVNRPQNTVRTLIKYVVSPISFLCYLMYF